MKASSAIRSTIKKVEAGCFDDILRVLEGENLGIWIRSCEVGGTVIPMPHGYTQEEVGDDLKIIMSEEIAEDAIRVGWFGPLLKADVACGCRCSVPCEGYVWTSEDKLDNVTELHPPDVESRVKALTKGGFLPMATLDAMGIGVFMVHGHGSGMPFSTLPYGIMAVIQNGRTRFCNRGEVLKTGGFIPTTWRIEEGERQPVGGFI